MKKLIILVIVSSFFAVSCKEDPDVTTSFYIKNTSEHGVTLTISKAEMHGIIRDTAFFLKPDSSISNSFMTQGLNNVYTYPFGPTADSAAIVFDSIVGVKYLLNKTQGRNILKIESYKGGKSKEDFFEYTFFITDEDYKQAIPLDSL